MNFGLTKKQLRQFDKGHKLHVKYFYEDESAYLEYDSLEKPMSKIEYFETLKMLGYFE